MQLHYVCQVKPFWYAPDNPCPADFFPYKDKCLKSEPEPLNYTDARVREIGSEMDIFAY